MGKQQFPAGREVESNKLPEVFVIAFIPFRLRWLLVPYFIMHGELLYTIDPRYFRSIRAFSITLFRPPIEKRAKDRRKPKKRNRRVLCCLRNELWMAMMQNRARERNSKQLAPIPVPTALLRGSRKKCANQNIITTRGMLSSLASLLCGGARLVCVFGCSANRRKCFGRGNELSGRVMFPDGTAGGMLRSMAIERH